MPTGGTPDRFQFFIFGVFLHIVFSRQRLLMAHLGSIQRHGGVERGGFERADQFASRGDGCRDSSPKNKVLLLIRKMTK